MPTLSHVAEQVKRSATVERPSMKLDDLGTLEPVDLKAVCTDEAGEFTPWLAKPENLARLSRELDMELEFEGIEVPVGPYRADIVATDNMSNERVIIENQLDKTDHDHLGKIITYASGLNAKVIIWIARDFTEEHRKALDFINENANPKVRCYGLEIALFRIGKSAPAPSFKIVSYPNTFGSDMGSSSTGFTETKALYLEFWTAFKEHCATTGTALNLRKARPQHWYSIAVGRSKFQISLTASTMYKRIGCEIYMRGANAKQAFKLLQQDKAAIETVTGGLEWQELPDGKDCRIVLFHPGVDPADKTGWKDAFAWLKKEAETFHKAFFQRIKSLPIEDEGEEDEPGPTGQRSS